MSPWQKRRSISIRKTSKRLGLLTEASQRFERGVDPEGVIHALNRAASLIHHVGDGKVARGCLDATSPHIPVPARIRVTAKRANQILGTAIDPEEMKSYLGRLGLKPRINEEGAIEVTAPSFRGDLKQSIDLIEEVARIHGFDRIPSTLRSHYFSRTGQHPFHIFEENVKRVMRSSGFQEVITYSFISPREIEALGLAGGDVRSRPLRILNPLSEAQSVMRPTLIPSLLSTTRRNIYQKNYDLKIFEIGKV